MARSIPHTSSAALGSTSEARKHLLGDDDDPDAPCTTPDPAGGNCRGFNHDRCGPRAETHRIEWDDGEHVTMYCDSDEEAKDQEDSLVMGDERHATTCRCTDCGEGRYAWLDRVADYQRECRARADALDPDDVWTIWTKAAWRSEDEDRWISLGMAVPECLERMWEAPAAATPAEAYERLVEYGAALDAALLAAEEDRLVFASPDPLLHLIGAWDPSSRPPKPPAILERPDGLPLVAEGLRHLVWADAGLGKSWFGLLAAIAVVKTGGRALYLDAEMSHDDMAARAYALTGDRDVLNRLGWQDPVDVEDRIDELLEWLRRAEGPTLVVLDSTSAFAPSTSADDILGFIRQWVHPFWKAGHATMNIDHSVLRKDGSRAPGPAYSLLKIRECDVAFELRGVPWTDTHPGRVTIRQWKDRHTINGLPRGTDAATLEGSTDDNGAFSLTIGAPIRDQVVDGPKADALADGVLDVVREAGAAGIESIRAVREAVKAAGIKGGNGSKDAALRSLVEDGSIVSESEGRSDRYTAAEYITSQAAF